MGPRLVSRGNFGAGLPAVQGFLASMGPRLVSRGNLRVVVVCRLNRPRFNGAATR